MSRSTWHKIRFALAFSWWFAAWSCLVVSLAETGEPWPWGGLSIYLSVVAATCTGWWLLELVAQRAVACICRGVEVLQQDNEDLPEILAGAVAQSLQVTRIDGKS